MRESFRSRWLRFLFNLFPAYRRTGARITYISPDLQQVRIKLPLNWKTKNYSGTAFGGSIYAAVDPVIPMIFTKSLGDNYQVWLKSASIDYKKPGRTTLYGDFHIPDKEIRDVRQACSGGEPVFREYHSELTDEIGDICAEIDQTIYIRLNT